jgi:hypothetical protein
MEKLIIATQTMFGKELRDEEAQSLRDLVEEAIQLVPRNSLKKKMRKDEASPNQARAHGRIPSLIKQRKGVDEVRMGSPM